MKIHHPYSLNNYDAHQIGADHFYFDEVGTRNKVIDFVETALLPSNALLLERVKKENWKIKLHISGIAIELFRWINNDAIESLKELISQQNVSIIQFPYYNSFSEVFSLKEYKEQIEKQAWLMKTMFGKAPVVQFCPGGDRCSQHLSPPVEYPHVNKRSEVNYLEKWMDSINRTNQSDATETNNGFWNKGFNRNLLQKLYRLEKMVKATGDSATLLNWRKLQDIRYYSFYSDQSRSDSLKNILADFEIVLIKKFLFKTKRSERDLPFIL